MKIVEKICDTLGLYKEVEEDVVEQEEALANPNVILCAVLKCLRKKNNLFSAKNKLARMVS